MISLPNTTLKEALTRLVRRPISIALRCNDIMAVSFLALGLTVAIAVIFLKLLSVFSHVGRPKLPPGPKGLPGIGNLNDMPPPGVLEAHHWLKHKELYGEKLSSCAYKAISHAAL